MKLLKAQTQSEQTTDLHQSKGWPWPMIQVTDAVGCLAAVPMVEYIRKGLIKDVLVSIRKGVEKCSTGLGLEMSDDQMVLLCQDIVDVYQHDSIEDVLLALKHGRQGKYGKVYGRLNMIVVGEWMARHLEEKAIARENAMMKESGNDEPRWNNRDEYVDAVHAGALVNGEIEKRKRSLLINEQKYQKFKSAYDIRKRKDAN